MTKPKLLLLSLPVYIFLLAFAWQTTTLKDIYEKKWITQKYGDPEMEIASPEVLQPMTIELPEEAKQYVVRMSTNQYQHDALLIMASSVAYKPDVTASLQGAADGSINEMKNRPGMEDFRYTEKSQTISGQEGIVQTGSFKVGNDRLDFHNIITVKGANMWQVFVAYKKGDAYGIRVKDKILKSIKI